MGAKDLWQHNTALFGRQILQLKAHHQMNAILGISAYYHDSAASLIIDGKTIAAAQEERFSRIKHDSSFPTRAIVFCLKKANIRLNDLDAVIYYEKPLLTFERLLETHVGSAPRGSRSFV